MSPADEKKAIWSQSRWTNRQFRNRFLPAITWFSILIALLVWQQSQGDQFTGVGWIEASERTLAPTVDGVIRTVSVGPLDHVEADAIVAIFDDSVVAAELVTAQAELGRLRLGIAAVERQVRRNAGSAQADLLRFFAAEEEARLTYLGEKVRLEADTVDLDRLEREFARVQDLYNKTLASEAAFDEARLRLAALQAERTQRDHLLEVSRKQLADAGARLREQQKLSPEASISQDLQPIHEEILVQEARINEIQQRRQQLTLRTPVEGQVVRILRHAGETALAGDPVLTILESGQSDVLAYVDGSAADKILPGAVAEVRSKDRPGRVATGTVARVGKSLGNIPRQLSSNPLISSSGLPILINGLKPDAFLPGERLSVVLKGNR